MEDSTPNVLRERRRAERPSDVLLARVCAVIDLLVESGMSEDGAAQTMARRMLEAGVSTPKGQQRSGWKRLLEWRAAHIRDNRAADEVMEAYRTVIGPMDALVAEDRLVRLLDRQIWDRRRQRRDALCV
jgi:hypothetical protein